MKKALFISYDGLSDPVGQSQIIPYMKGISKAGWKIFILSFEKEDRFLLMKKSIENELILNDITWIPLRYTKKPPIISTLWDFWRMKRVAAKVCKQHKISIIHARSYLPAMAALRVKRKLSVPYIFDMRGFWADERIDGQLWSMKNPLFRNIYFYFKREERKVLKCADSIVSLTHNAAEFMVKNWMIPVPKINVIPCAADYKHFNPQTIDVNQISELKRELGVKDQTKILLYHGSVGTWYLAEHMFAFFKELIGQYPDSLFLWCTNENPDWLIDLANKYGVNDNTRIIAKVSRLKMPLYLALADWCIMFIKDSFSKKASSPIKYAEALAMGKPVICNSGVGDMGLNELNNFGFNINQLEQKEFSIIVDKMLQTKFDADFIRFSSQHNFGLDQNISAYLNVYNSIEL